MKTFIKIIYFNYLDYLAAFFNLVVSTYVDTTVVFFTMYFMHFTEYFQNHSFFLNLSAIILLYFSSWLHV